MLEKIDEGEKDLLLGAKARSGKTYCVGGLFVKYYKKYNKLNALIITPAPTETLSQFTDDLFHKFRDFIGINIIEIKLGLKKEKKNEKKDKAFCCISYTIKCPEKSIVLFFIMNWKCYIIVYRYYIPLWMLLFW